MDDVRGSSTALGRGAIIGIYPGLKLWAILSYAFGILERPPDAALAERLPRRNPKPTSTVFWMDRQTWVKA